MRESFNLDCLCYCSLTVYVVNGVRRNLALLLSTFSSFYLKSRWLSASAPLLDLALGEALLSSSVVTEIVFVSPTSPG